MILQILQPLLRYILIGLIIYLVYWALKNLLRGRRGDSVQAPAPPPEVEEMVQDPVCGVYISKDSAVTESRGGTQYYFCGEECRSKFKEES